MNKIKNSVILFDGVCNLCCKSVHFIIQHDPQKKFRFASLQSDFGKEILKRADLPSPGFNSFILWEEGKAHTQSTAALKVVKQLPGAWKIMYIFIIVPAFIRNYIYSIIANNRYKWFGKKEECWLPSKELKALFFE